MGRREAQDDLAAAAPTRLHASKKTFRSTERDEELRAQFRAALAGGPAEQRVYLEETGIANHEARPSHPTRQSACCAPPPDLLAPLVCEGTCNTALFDA
jgi:hypothetical protein